MPLRIKGKVLDGSGLPIGHAIEIKEIPPEGSGISAADVFADDAGNFEILALSPDSLIQIVAYGYQTQVFPASDVPETILMPDDPLSEITVSRKKDNTLAYVLGTLAAVGLLYAATRGKKPVGALPAAKKPTIKKVSV